MRRTLHVVGVVACAGAFFFASKWGFSQDEKNEPAPAVVEISLNGISLLTCVEETLDEQPNIFIQREQTFFQKGVAQFEAGQFDVVLQSSLARTRDVVPQQEGSAALIGSSRQVTESTEGTLGVTKRFRSGITVGPQASLIESNTSADNLPIANRAKIDFVLQTPLLRGFGENATGAPEKAAKKDYEASLAQLRFTVSQSILNTSTAYWNYLAAQRNLEIFKESEDRARILVEETQKLVEGEEQPASNMDQLRANLADKMANRIRGEQSLISARTELGLAMGIPAAQIQAIPFPSTDFPENPQHPFPSFTETNFLTRLSLERRGDLAALKLNAESSKILLGAARNGLLHRLDLNVSGGYAGLEEGAGADDYFGSIDENISGGNFQAAVKYEWPFANSAARGQFLQAKSAYEQSKLRVYDLSRSIPSQVAVAASALERNSKELDKSHEAVQLYYKAVESEKEKQRLGMSTLIDVIDIEDRLLTTKLNHVSGQQRYAIALAVLRFETGTLVDSIDEKSSITIDALTSYPKPE